MLNYQIYTGTSGPYNFNGLVRHYYMRHQPNEADIQVNLLPANQRSEQSHAIAKRMRPLLVAIGNALWSSHSGERSAARPARRTNSGGGDLWSRMDGQIRVALDR